MIKSMTGYGRGEAVGAGKRITVEIKAVNHRYCEVVVRTPRAYVSLEEPLKRLVSEKVARGRVDVFVNFEDDGKNPPIVKVDKVLAKSYYQTLKELAEELKMPLDVSIARLVEFPEVLQVVKPDEDVDAIAKASKQALADALLALLAMRQDEGKTLACDLVARLDRMKQFIDEIENRAPLVVEEYRQRLQERMTAMLGDIPLDEQRIANEVAHFADRASIAEEVVRFRSHLEQFHQSLEVGETVGRKLDFLVQEMNREINTIGSKANNLDITRYVVEAKSELEKVREQVQNIE